MSVNSDLRAFFKKRGLTQKDIGERIGAAQPAVALLLSRDYIPDKAARKLEEAFGLSYTWLRTGMGPMMADGSEGGVDIDNSAAINSIQQRILTKDNAENYGGNYVYNSCPDVPKKLDDILKEVEGLSKEIEALKDKVDRLENVHLGMISKLVFGKDE